MYTGMDIGATRAAIAHGYPAAGNKEAMDGDGEEDVGINQLLIRACWFCIY